MAINGFCIVLYCLGYHILIIEAQQTYLVISIKLFGLFYVYVCVFALSVCMYCCTIMLVCCVCIYIVYARIFINEINFALFLFFCILIVFIYHFVCRFVFMYYINCYYQLLESMKHILNGTIIFLSSHIITQSCAKCHCYVQKPGDSRKDANSFPGKTSSDGISKSCYFIPFISGTVFLQCVVFLDPR